MPKVFYTEVSKNGLRLGAKSDRESVDLMPGEQERDMTARTRCIRNALRLLVALIILISLVVIVILSTHIAVRDTSSTTPIPWDVAPVAEPARLKIKNNPIRRYVTCNSKLGAAFADKRWMSFEANTHWMSFAAELTHRESLLNAELSTYRRNRWIQNCTIIRLNVSSVESENTNFKSPLPEWGGSVQHFPEMKCYTDYNERLLNNETRTSYKYVGHSSNQIHSRIQLFPLRDPDPLYLNIVSTTVDEFFQHTPFSTMWKKLLSENIKGDNLFDRCVRLLLVWRYGGMALDLQGVIPKRLPDISNADVVIIERDTAAFVYSRKACSLHIEKLLLALENGDEERIRNNTLTWENVAYFTDTLFDGAESAIPVPFVFHRVDETSM